MGVHSGDPERVPVLSSESEDGTDDDDEDVNLSEIENELEDYDDSNYTEGEDTHSLNTEEENDDENYIDDQGNYVVKDEGDVQYLLPLDDMNEEEFQDLLDELQIRGHDQSNVNRPQQMLQQHTCVDTTGENIQEQQHQYQQHQFQQQQYQHMHQYQHADTTATRQKHINSASNSMLYPSLHLVEITFYFCAFWMGAGYSLYTFYRASQKWSTYLPLTLTPGRILGRQRDDTDVEWYVWPSMLLPYIHYAVLHCVVATAVRKYAHKHLCLFYIVSSVFATYNVLGSMGLILCLTVPSLMFTVLLTRNKQMVWVTWCLILLCFNMEPVTSTLEQFMSPIAEGDYKVSVMVAWIILRSLSYCLETCDADPDNNLPITRQLLTLFSYCLYLPFLFTGPYMPYVDFMTGLNAPYRPWSWKRVMVIVIQLVRFSIWTTLCYILINHFYAHALHWSPQVVVRLNSWALTGFLYYLMIFFMLKYVVLYGFPGAIASIEGYKAPPPPKCVLIICRFSHLWRDFDHGLFIFMKSHIYLPWVANADSSFISKLQGTALVFTFVYVWHGVTPQVMLWAGINFLGIILEKSADAIGSKPAYKNWEQRWLSPRWRRRWYGLLSMFLLVPSVTAQAVFLSSLENAQTVGYRLFVEGAPQLTLTVMFFMYCIAQISFEVQNWKLRRGDKVFKIK